MKRLADFNQICMNMPFLTGMTTYMHVSQELMNGILPNLHRHFFSHFSACCVIGLHAVCLNSSISISSFKIIHPRIGQWMKQLLTNLDTRKKKRSFSYPKNSTVKFYIYTVMRLEDANGISNSVNPGETTVCLQCLSRPVWPKTYGFRSSLICVCTVCSYTSVWKLRITGPKPIPLLRDAIKIFLMRHSACLFWSFLPQSLFL